MISFNKTTREGIGGKISSAVREERISRLSFAAQIVYGSNVPSKEPCPNDVMQDDGLVFSHNPELNLAHMMVPRCASNDI